MAGSVVHCPTELSLAVAFNGMVVEHTLVGTSSVTIGPLVKFTVTVFSSTLQLLPVAGIALKVKVALSGKVPVGVNVVEASFALAKLPAVVVVHSAVPLLTVPAKAIGDKPQEISGLAGTIAMGGAVIFTVLSCGAEAHVPSPDKVYINLIELIVVFVNV